MIDYILFLNEWEGLGFMLKRKLAKESIVIDELNSKDHLEKFKQYNIKTTPVLVILDNSKESSRLTTTDEIVEYLKHVSDTQT